MSEEQKPIVTHYLKNSDFKTCFSTGVTGGITINGLINMNFCIDRSVIPAKTESVIENNQIKEVKREGKEGVIREVQVGILLDINTAKATILWLQGQIKQIEELQSQNAISKK